MSFGYGSAVRVLQDAGYKEGQSIEFGDVVQLLVDEHDDANEEVRRLERDVRELQGEIDNPTLVQVECARCQKTFLSHEGTKYCSIGCELGYAPGTWWR